MQLKGTGKDPLGRYVKGQVFDIADGDLEAKQLVDAGYAEAVGDEITDKRRVEIANAVVRGDALSHPHDQKVADEFRDVNQPSQVDGNGDPVKDGKTRGGERPPHDVVHLADPNAKEGASDLTREQARERVAASQPLVTTTDGEIQRPGETGGQTAEAGGKVGSGAKK